MENKSGFKAVGKYLFGSSFKIRPVADLVRNLPYVEALAILEHTTNKGGHMIRKVVASAAANALNQNKKLEEDMLYVKELRIDEGPRLRRIWFRARGRADMQIKRMCHITAIVDEIGKAEK